MRLLASTLLCFLATASRSLLWAYDVDQSIEEADSVTERINDIYESLIVDDDAGAPVIQTIFEIAASNHELDSGIPSEVTTTDVDDVLRQHGSDPEQYKAA